MIAALDLPTALPGVDAAIVRRATSEDVPRIVELLANDAIALGRGDAADGDLDAYRVGFDAIAADAANDVVVVERRGTIIGTVQLTRTPGMTRRGATRLTVESVRVAEEARGAGVGSALLAWVGDVAAPAVGASLLQLTSDARRSDAIRWYERAGFTASHIGLKRDVR